MAVSKARDWIAGVLIVVTLLIGMYLLDQRGLSFDSYDCALLEVSTSSGPSAPFHFVTVDEENGRLIIEQRHVPSRWEHLSHGARGQVTTITGVTDWRCSSSIESDE